MNCESVFVDSDSDIGVLCGRTDIANCSDCGTAICDDWNVADNHFVEPVTASMQRVRALGSLFRLNSRVVSWAIKSQPEGVGRTRACRVFLAGPSLKLSKAGPR
jgi:hypothetical protein